MVSYNTGNEQGATAYKFVVPPSWDGATYRLSFNRFSCVRYYTVTPRKVFLVSNMCTYMYQNNSLIFGTSILASRHVSNIIRRTIMFSYMWFSIWRYGPLSLASCFIINKKFFFPPSTCTVANAKLGDI